MQRRLARLAKAQQPFNSLVAALEKASASAITWVESEKLRQLPRLGKTVLNINSDSQDIPHCFRLQSSVVQRSLSHQGSLSTPQRPLSLLQVASDVPRCEASMLWVVPRRTWPLSSTGGRLPPSERTPRLLISLGEPTLSAASPSPSLVLVLSTDSRSIVVEPRAEKHFQKELPLPSFASGIQAARQTAAYKRAPAAAEPKAARSDTVADNPLGAEQSPCEDGTGEVGREAVLKVRLHHNKVNSRVYRQNQKWKGRKSHRGNHPLRKNSAFISKPFHPAKKRSFQKNFSIEYGDGQFGLSESFTANCTDSHRLPSPAAAAPDYSVPPGYIPAPTPEDACYNVFVVVHRLSHCMVMTGCFQEQAEWMTGVVSPGYKAMEEIYSYINRHLASHQSPPVFSGVDY